MAACFTRFFKICDHVEAGEITVLWRPGATNPTDLFTKALNNQEALPHVDLLPSSIPYSPEVMGGCKGFNKLSAAAGANSAKRARKALNAN